MFLCSVRICAMRLPANKKVRLSIEGEDCLKTFAELGLMPELLRAVRDAAYDTPTPIQTQAIPVVLRGDDVLGCAQTGTGKTAGFLLPLLQRLACGKRCDLRALVLTPTRELAAQIGESARTYGKYLRLRTAVIFGGVSLGPQAGRLRHGIDLLVATPGRLLDHMGRGNVKFSALEVLVLDEADRMLDMGFLPDVRRILRALPSVCQTLLFSATMPQEVEILARQTLKSPVVIDVGRRATPVAAIRQVIYPVEAELKCDLLCHLLKHGNMKQVLVFTRTKVRAERLARHLAQTGRRVAALHGDKGQGARTQALSDFRYGSVEVLVATDIAARGLDVEGISHVVNFDVPTTPEDYVHRVGRTARANATGDAVSLASSEDVDCVRAIERLIGVTIPRRVVVGFEPGAETVRRFTQPVASRAARVASGAIRRFGPRGRRSRRSA
jgi:ATP-dependent RNA helicase RhlE